MIDSQTIEATVQALEKRLIRVEKQLTNLKLRLRAAGSEPEWTESDKSADELLMEAAKLFTQYELASSSLIQRKLSVGYARAARILDQLYEAGLVGPDNGPKPREVFRDKITAYLAKQPS